MFLALILMLAQTETTFHEPWYFAPVMLGMLLVGAVAATVVEGDLLVVGSRVAWREIGRVWSDIPPALRPLGTETGGRGNALAGLWRRSGSGVGSLRARQLPNEWLCLDRIAEEVFGMHRRRRPL